MRVAARRDGLVSFITYRMHIEGSAVTRRLCTSGEDSAKGLVGVAERERGLELLPSQRAGRAALDEG